MYPIAQEVKTILPHITRHLRQKSKQFSTHGLTFALMLMLAGTVAFSGPTNVRTVKAKTPERIAKISNSDPRKAVSDSAVPGPPASQPATPAAEILNLPPTLSGGTQSLNPALLSRFDSFRTFIYQKYGAVLEINSGYRSSEEQAYLFRTLPPGRANPPGVSLHEKGEAIDYTPGSATYNQHLPAFGLKVPYPGKEDWHIERADY